MGGNPNWFDSGSVTSQKFGGKGYDELTVSSISYPILGGSAGQTNVGGRATPLAGGVQSNVEQAPPEVFKTPDQYVKPNPPQVIVQMGVGLPPMILPNQSNLNQPIPQTRTDLPQPGVIRPPEVQPRQLPPERQTFGLGITEEAIKTTDVLLSDLDRAKLGTSEVQKNVIRGGVAGLFLNVDLPAAFGKDLARAVGGRPERETPKFFKESLISISSAGSLALAGNFKPLTNLAAFSLGTFATGGALSQKTINPAEGFTVKRFVGLEIKTAERTAAGVKETQLFKPEEGLRSNLQRTVVSSSAENKIIVQEIKPKFEVLTSKKPILLEPIEGSNFEANFELTSTRVEKGITQTKQQAIGRGTLEVKPETPIPIQEVSLTGVKPKVAVTPSVELGSPQLVRTLNEIPRNIIAKVGESTFMFKTSEGRTTVFGLEQTPQPFEFSRAKTSKVFSYSVEGEQLPGKTVVELGGIVKTKPSNVDVALQRIDVKFKFQPDPTDLIEVQKKTIGETLPSLSAERKTPMVFNQLGMLSPAELKLRAPAVAPLPFGKAQQVLQLFKEQTIKASKSVSLTKTSQVEKVKVFDAAVPKSLGFSDVKPFEVLTKEAPKQPTQSLSKATASISFEKQNPIKVTVQPSSPVFKQSSQSFTSEIPAFKELPISKTVSPLKEIPSSKQIQPPMEIQPPRQIVPNKQIQPPSQIVPTKEIQPPMQIVPTKEIQPPMQIVPTKQIQPPVEIPPLKEIPPAKQTIFELTPNVPTIPKISFKRDRKLFSFKGEKAFAVFVRRKGKFLELETPKPLTRGEALVKGLQAVGTSAAATFKIRPTGKLASANPSQQTIRRLPSDYLYQPKTIKPMQAGEEIFTERSKYRIKSRGELEEITFKGIAARRKNKTFGVF